MENVLAGCEPTNNPVPNIDPDPALPLDGNDALVENEPEGDTAREAPLEETPDASFTEEDEGDAVDNELVPVVAVLEDPPSSSSSTDCLQDDTTSVSTDNTTTLR